MGKLGHQPSVALAPWPEVDPTLLVEDEVEAIIQVNGKIKERVSISPNITEEEFRELAMSIPSVAAEIAGKTPKAVIVRPPKLVNIVLGN